VPVTGQKNVGKANQIGRDKVLRRLKGVSNTGLSGQMDDPLGANAAHPIQQLGGMCDIEALPLHAWRLPHCSHASRTQP
jgi:hypothetical protein